MIMIILLIFASITISFTQQNDSVKVIKDSLLLINNNTLADDSLKYYKDYRDPFTAGLYSFIIPGLAFGQLYNKDYLRWAVRLGISGTCIGVSYFNFGNNKSYAIIFISALIYAGNWVTSIFEASRRANEINTYNKFKRNSNTRKIDK